MTDVKDTVLWRRAAAVVPINLLIDFTENLQVIYDLPADHPCKAGGRNVSFNHPRANIDQCIIWDETPQGHTYWQRFDRMFRDGGVQYYVEQ